MKHEAAVKLYNLVMQESPKLQGATIALGAPRGILERGIWKGDAEKEGGMEISRAEAAAFLREIAQAISPESKPKGKKK